METSDSIALGAVAIASASLYFTWRGSQRADRIEKRADAAAIAAETLARREAIKFEFAGSNENGMFFRHVGHEPAVWLEFDTSRLSNWEVTYFLTPITTRPGESIRLGLQRNRNGDYPDSIRLTWKEPFEGSQIVPVPAESVPARPDGD